MRGKAFLDYGIIAVVAIALALGIQAFIVKPYRIPSPSMVETLLRGDRVLANRLVYHFRAVERRDIVVFKYPRDPKVNFIKRVIGLPGDVLSVKDGSLYVNGERLEEPYVRRINGVPEPTNPWPATGGSTMSDSWSLNRPYKVPAGHYFMMGDNRTESDDSRDWGPVPEENVIGEAFMIYWPVTRIGLL